jgi:hypothetical protein
MEHLQIEKKRRARKYVLIRVLNLSSAILESMKQPDYT